MDLMDATTRSCDSDGSLMPPAKEIRCPIARTAILIGDRWTPLIVRDLEPGCRLSELQRSLNGISPKTLSDRLRRLEEAEVISRTCFAEVPPRVEYRLTGKGHALLSVLESMRTFGEEWLADERPDSQIEPADCRVPAHSG
jgi:DNA-binding HxlR family transcriptional regulator